VNDNPDPTPLAREFRLDPEVAYLNHAAVAPWPERTARAIARFAEENLRRGAQHYPQWLAVEQRLRGRLARLLGAHSPDDIALLKSTSEGLSLVAHGLAWADGDNVVGVQADFPSNRVVWQSLARYGVAFRGVDVVAAADPEQALMDACDRDTRLLAVSSVHFVTGLRLDLARLGAFCRQRGILFCVDAIQSLGALQFDVQACQADFVMADGHKWMLGPEGVALFYCRQSSMERLALKQYGWHMLEHYLDFDRHSWDVAGSARRFECGSPNMTGIHALHASLGLIHEIGMQAIENLVLENTRFMLDFFSQHAQHFRLLTPLDSTRHAGIVTFQPLQESAAAVHRMLTGELVACALRGGGVRFSPHFYTPRKQLFRALELLLD